MSKVKSEPDRGQEVLSRRAVVGATVGGVGAATLVGVAAAAAWPDTTVNTTVEGTGGAGATGGVPATDSGGKPFAVFDPNAVPADSFKAYDPVLAPATAETNRVITTVAREDVGEVAPGVTQNLWNFDGKVPGPVHRGRLGDKFTVTLKNEGTLGHSIDFHASKVAPNVRMATIQPGETLEYPFEAKHHGIYMYHCGTPPVLHHIGTGMYGVVVIDPPDLAPVDHEFLFVQSEFYLGPEGEPGDMNKMANEQWDLVVFNGYASQYVHRPIRVEVGERVRAWVSDVGPSENCSFHVIGTIFDTVYKEGNYLLRPDGGKGGSQSLDLQPAQGGFVEFTFDEPGLYPFATHKFANPGKGALGVFQAGDVEPPADGGAGH
ncbi:MAG TPA: multicopper oxidase domain-containing protein [Microthrixaceae bacterium]|nr:multicopper oxidase domain-containing protein [Microthrixaceae bacterium]